MTADEILIDRIRLLVKRRKGIAERKMVGGITITANGNMAADTWKEWLVVHLDKASHEQKPNHPNARELDAAGRVMNGGLMVDPDGIEDDRSLEERVTRGIACARTLPPKGTGEKGAKAGA